MTPHATRIGIDNRDFQAACKLAVLGDRLMECIQDDKCARAAADQSNMNVAHFNASLAGTEKARLA